MIFGRHEWKEARADALLFRETEQPAIVLVDERPRPVGPPLDDELGLVLDDQAVARFALAQLLLDALAIGDVAEHADEPRVRQTARVDLAEEQSSRPCGENAIRS